MKNEDPQIIAMLYRTNSILYSHALGAALTAVAGYTLAIAIPPFHGILIVLTIIATATSCIALAATLYARAIYRLHPFCPTCGIDAVDCKINRKSLSRHIRHPRDRSSQP